MKNFLADKLYEISSGFDVGAEVELLLCCLRSHVNSRESARIKKLLKMNLDWDQLTELCHRHRVMPLFYIALTAAAPEHVPSAVLDRLKRRFNVNRFHNQFLTNELIAVLNLLTKHEVTAVPYKGPVLAALLYGDVSQRQFVDLDVLVPERDVLRARNILMSQGYRPRATLDPVEEGHYFRGDYEYRLVRDDKPVTIGLHWRLGPRYLHFSFEAMHVWDRLERIPVSGTTLPSFRREDLLVLLCIHGAKDLWKSLGWICDLAVLINRHKELDWHHVLSQATHLGGRRMLLVGVGLAHFLLGVEVPRDILRQMQRETTVLSLLLQIRERLFSFPSEGSGENEKKFVFYLWVRERFRDRLRMYPELMYLRHWLPPSAVNRAFWQLPAPLDFLHPILWPLHLFGKCVTSVILRFQR